MLKKLLGAACGDDNNCQSDECHDNCRSECHSKVWHCLVVDKVEDKVKSIVAEQLGLDVCIIDPDSSFTKDLSAGSLDAIELIMAIEEVFNFEILDEEAEMMTTPVEYVVVIKVNLS